MNGLLTEAAEETRDEKIARHQGLVGLVAKEFAGLGTELEDLKQAGQFGLMTAVERYDPDRGVKFGTYARPWIANAIRREVIATSRPIRLPEWAFLAVGQYRRAFRVLARDNGGESPTPAEVFAAMGTPESKRESILAAVDSASLKFTEDGMDRQSAEPDALDDATADAEMLSRLASSLGSLDEKARTFLTARFGLDGGVPASLSESARRAHVDRVRAVKVQDDALAQLRSAILAPAPEPPTKATPPLGDGRVDEVRRLLDAGVSQRKAARVLGVSLGTVSRINRGLSYAGVPSRELGVAV